MAPADPAARLKRRERRYPKLADGPAESIPTPLP